MTDAKIFNCRTICYYKILNFHTYQIDRHIDGIDFILLLFGFENAVTVSTVHINAMLWRRSQHLKELLNFI